MKRKDLERAMEAVPDFVDPKPDMEQYRTPAHIAAELLWAAWEDGDIAGKQVLDLGCGTGVLSLGASMLGGNVIGVDADEQALDVARTHVPNATFHLHDLSEGLDVTADTVIMNPPFGAQRRNRNGDRVFYEAAIASGASAIWFLAPVVGQKFLTAFANESRLTVEKVLEWDYPLTATMDHHRESVRTIKVGGYRMGR